jgi:mannan endo-1,4-beta-mannosidase
MTSADAESDIHWRNHRKSTPRRRRRRAVIISTAAFTVCAVTVGVALFATSTSPSSSGNVKPTIPYLGIFEPDAPNSYSGLDQVAHAIGRRPDLAVYYSHWLQPFRVTFATAAAKHGATTLVQIAPGKYSLESIASGRYDAYLRSYATAIKAFGAPVILSFGHEMNGSWYPWGRKHTSPTLFVKAWRHVVIVFRQMGATKVTWLWTVNIMGTSTPGPRPWWPGRAYVNWVGIDGYFWYKAAEFDSVFGPTIAYVREFTHEPILIGETGASPADGQPAKIAELFAGVRAFGLLGFVWFDSNDQSPSIPGEVLDWRLTSASLAVLRQDVKEYVELQPNRSRS